MAMKHSALWSFSKFLRLELAAAYQVMKCKTYACIGARALNELNKQHKVQAVSTEQNCDSKLRASFFYDDDSEKRKGVSPLEATPDAGQGWKPRPWEC